MAKMRLLMRKEGLSKYISHLDLMRTMRRAFSRADIPLRHSEGFNPHPVMAFALPLSVCHESGCELLDFEPTASVDAGTLKRLCMSLPEGLDVLEIYNSGRKFSQIRWLEVKCALHYPAKMPDNAVSALERHFASGPLIVRKRTKRGEAEIDILPMIRRISFAATADTVVVTALVSAQNPTLNPSGIVDAISPLDGFAPDSADFRRIEVFDEDLKIFR